MFRIASWNINSIRARLARLLEWLEADRPDLVCLQETKVTDAEFPRAQIEALGYGIETLGQKSYNGVALLCRREMSAAARGLPGGAGDDQARYIEARVGFKGGAVLRAASLYLPNGNPAESGKFSYKLDWMARLNAHAQNLLGGEEIVILAGDYNVIPDSGDVFDPEAFAEDALYRIEVRRLFRALLYSGFTDALRACHDPPGPYSFWDYQQGRFRKDQGLRIDHILLSPAAADRLCGAGVVKEMRAGERPSDHAPVFAELDI